MKISEAKLRRLIRRSLLEQMQQKQNEVMDKDLMAKIAASVKAKYGDAVFDVEAGAEEREKKRAELKKKGKSRQKPEKSPAFGSDEYSAEFKKKYGKYRSPYS